MGQDTAWRRHVKKIFDEALEKPPGERAAFLDSACDGEPEIRARVERLLSMIDDDPGFLEEPPRTTGFGAGDLADLDGDDDLTGKRLSHYDLQRAIATGGMGTVYEAVQENPHRTVAVKVMKQGIASRSAMRRFEYEAQILARLRHPGIAQVYEAGTYDEGNGVPYFVMEYVPNALHITEYARQRKLTTPQRLELFRQVCEAVHHGHQRGIIHRDLKPANILVDPSGQPKIIDFGVARATDSDIALTTLHTHLGELVGTLQYMSPEQCQADPHDLDTRSDVYSLGVVLYELLCDRLPYDVTHAPVPEAVRVIRDETPIRPSTVNRTLRGDLETVVLKALEKDRQRRYQSALELSADIARYLSHEPIEARPPSAIYQFRKFARRNRAVVAAGSVVALSLVVAAAVSVWFALSEAQQREIADRARAETDERAAELEKVVDFQASMLSDVDPEAMGRSIVANLRQSAESSLLEAGLEPAQAAELLATFDRTIGAMNATNLALQILDEHVLARAADAIGSSFADQPRTEASLRQTVADTYQELGLLDESMPHQERALEVRRRVLGDEHPHTLSSINNIGFLLLMQGHLAAAEPYCREALAVGRRVLGNEHPVTLESIDNMGRLLEFQGRQADAEPYFREALEGRRRVLGDDHQDTLISITHMGCLLRAQGRLAEAEPYTREALEVRRRLLGDEHPRTLTSINNMGSLLQAQGQLAEAEPYFREALEGFRRVLGDDQLDTLISKSNFARLLVDLGNASEAERLAGDVVERARATFGPKHRLSGRFLGEHGRALVALAQFDEAESELVDAHIILGAALGDQHDRTRHVVGYLADLYHAWGKPELAAEYRAMLPVEQDTVATD